MERPEEKEDLELWKKIHDGHTKPSLQELDIKKAGYGKKQSTGGKTGMRSWQLRWFALTGRFLVYSHSDQLHRPISGGVYLKGGEVVTHEEFCGMSHCLELKLQVARRPGVKLKEDATGFVISFNEPTVAEDWANELREAVSSVGRAESPTSPPSEDPEEEGGEEVGADSPRLEGGEGTGSRRSSAQEETIRTVSPPPEPRSTSPPRIETDPPPEEEGEAVVDDGMDLDGNPIGLDIPPNVSLPQSFQTLLGTLSPNTRDILAPLLELLTMGQELVAPVTIPRINLTCFFRIIFSDHCDLLNRYHQGREDFEIAINPWPAQPNNGPPHCCGWRDAEWQSVVHVPQKKTVGVYEKQFYAVAEDGSGKAMVVGFSSFIPKVPMGDSFRVEALVEVKEKMGADGPSVVLRILGNVRFSKGGLLKKKIESASQKEMKTTWAKFADMVKAAVSDWESANKQELDRRRAPSAGSEPVKKSPRRSRSREQGAGGESEMAPVAAMNKAAKEAGLLPVPQSPKNLSISLGELSFSQPRHQPSHSATSIDTAQSVRCTAFQDLAAIPDITLSESAAPQRILESLLWQGLACNPTNPMLASAAIESINQMVNCQQGETLQRHPLQQALNVGEFHIRDIRVQQAVLGLLLTYCSTESNTQQVREHPGLARFVEASLAKHSVKMNTPDVQKYRWVLLGDQAAGQSLRATKERWSPNEDDTMSHASGHDLSVSGSTITSRSSVPTKKEQVFLERFPMAASERLIDDFMCAYREGMLLRQGTLYITSRAAYFHAPLPVPWTIVITVSSIKLLEKKKTIILFDNAIEISTRDGNLHFFTSFLSRDRAFDLLQQMVRISGEMRNSSGSNTTLASSNSQVSDSSSSSDNSGEGE